MDWYINKLTECVEDGGKWLKVFVEKQTQDELTPLFLACYMGYRYDKEDNDAKVVKENRLKIVKLLCNLEADVNF